MSTNKMHNGFWGFLPGGALLAFGLWITGCDKDHSVMRGTGGTSATGGQGTGGAETGGAGTGGAIGTGGGAPDSGVTDGPMDGPAGGGGSGGASSFVDTDIGVVRLNADGTLDATFGTNGIARIDFGPGSAETRDALWGLAVDSQNRVVLFGSKKGAGTRVDSDRVVARLTPAGALDTAFNNPSPDGGTAGTTPGMNVLNIANLGDSPRNGIIQPDGKIVSAGYTAQPTGVGAQAANRVVLLRLNDDGTPDTTFGAAGIVNSAPFVPADPINTQWGMAEAYGVVNQAGKYVTTGYGRAASSGQVNMVSFRYTAAGALDTTWGMNGIAELEIAGFDDRGRNLTVFPDPDNRVVIAGSGIPMTAGRIDAMVAILLPTGARDTAFNTTGYKLYDFGRNDEAFYGVSVSPSKSWIAAAGYRAGTSLDTDAGVEDEDAILAFIPAVSGGTEFAQAVPLSATENDRFWGVAFDANNKAVAAGFVAQGNDTWMAVARYNTDGTVDTTFAGGVVKVNVSVAGNVEAARGVAVQGDGKIVIAGTIERP